MNLIFSNKIWLAPLAGYTNSVYRKICKFYGADVVMSEMISADALIHRNQKTKILAEFDEEERPIGLQIFGNDAKKIAEGIKILRDFQPNFIDINMGCPIKKIVKNGSGAALLKNLKKIKRIVSSAVKVIDSEFPLTIKIRSGWNSGDNLLEIVKIIEAEGAAGICLHPRTKMQMFSGESNWNLIREVKEKIEIPIIGNGDIKIPEDAKKMFKQTNCDSIMIGRDAIGSPWIFRHTKNYLQNNTYHSILPSKKIEMILFHFQKMSEKVDSKTALKLMRKFIPYYTKGIQGASKLRQMCNQINDERKFIQYLLDFKAGFENG